MSVDWQATAGVLALGGVGLAVVGMMVQTAAGVSLRKRERTTSVGMRLMGVGLFLAGGLFFAVNDDVVIAIGGFLGVGLVATAVIAQNKLTRWLPSIGYMMLFSIQLRQAWLRDEVAEFFRTGGVVLGSLALLVLVAWIGAKLLLKSKPGPGAPA